MTSAPRDDRARATVNRSRDRSTRRSAMLMGLLAWLAVLLTLDGPGLTVDEPLDVRPGRTYLTTFWNQGRHFFARAVVYRVFRDNAEHPPMGRWLLGIASTLGEPFEVLLKGPDPTGPPMFSPADWHRRWRSACWSASSRRSRAVSWGTCRRHRRGVRAGDDAPRLRPRASGCARYIPGIILDHGPPRRRSRLAIATPRPGHDGRRSDLVAGPAHQDSCLVSPAPARLMVARAPAASACPARHGYVDGRRRWSVSRRDGPGCGMTRGRGSGHTGRPGHIG